jgi:hypothetical protein
VATVTVSLNSAASNLVVGTYSATLWFTNQNDQVGQSRQFTLSVISPPIITQQPTNQASIEGATVAFSVQATGGMPLAYQWQFNGTNLTDGGNISGSSTTNLMISSVSAANVGTYAVIVTNYAGAAISSNALLTLVPSPPVIVLQPTNQSVSVGATVQFVVGAIGTTPLAYQWSFDGTNIANATNAILTLTDVQLSQSGNYAVLVSNINGSTNSTTAVLTIMPCDPVPSGIVAWWQAEDNALDSVGGNNGTLMNGTGFTGGEVGTAFSFNGVNNFLLVGTPSPGLTTGLQNGFTFECWINPATVANTVELLEYERALATGNGSDVGILFAIHNTLPDGSPGSCLYANVLDTSSIGHVAASPAGLLTAGQWQHVALTYDKLSGMTVIYFNGLPVTQTNLGSFTPQTSFTNILLGARTTYGSVAYPPNAYAGNMDEISFYNRALSSNEIAAIYLAGGQGKCFTPMPPVITTQPTNQTVEVGKTAIFAVTASGTPPLAYQWNFNGTNILNATNAILTLTSVQLNQTGDYSVLVSNPYGSTNGAIAVLAVYALPPTIIAQPTNQTVAVGGTATFTVAATGTPPLAYQWSFNGTNIANATNATLTLNNVQLNQSGNYSVQVSNPYGTTNSVNALLTVYGIPPFIAIQPTNKTVIVGNAAVFSVTATGTSPLTYQWSFNGTNIANATNAILTLNSAQFTNAGNYSVLVTNLFGSTNSANAILTVIPPPPCDPASSGLIAWWAGESNYLDSAGLNNSTPENSLGFTTGEVGTAFSFNGVNNFLLVGTPSPGLTTGLQNGFTFECWIKPATVANTVELLEYERALATFNGSDVGILFAIHNTLPGGLPGSCLYANILDTTSAAHEIASPAGLLTAGQWQHISLTYDKPSGLAVIYFNGQPVSQVNLGSFTPQTSFTNILLGARTTYGSVANPPNAYAGSMDEISFYSHALSSNEIAAIYLAGSAGKCPLPPTIFSQPTNRSVNLGGTAAFNVLAGGTPALKYQWSFNATNIANATNATLTLTGVQLANAGNYSVLIVNTAGSTNSSNAVLTVQAPPVITSQPTNQTVAAGGTASFTVTASGTPSLSYQWYFNTNSLLLGATNTTLTLSNAQLVNQGYYSVRVTNLFGSATSTNALLIVQAPPVITLQPTNLTVNVGATAVFTTAVTGSVPLSYQWSFNTINITGATNAILTIPNVQLANAGVYALTATNAFGTAVSSNVTLTVIDVLDHFSWSPIPSLRFVNAPFGVAVQARDSINQVFSNFTGTVALTVTNGAALSPLVSSNFIQGVWVGSVTIPQTATNLVLQANDGAGHFGLANPINVMAPPSLAMAQSGSSLLIFWPVDPAGFVLETTPSLVPPQWTKVTIPPLQIGNQFLESIQTSGTNQYYRLRFTLP